MDNGEERMRNRKISLLMVILVVIFILGGCNNSGDTTVVLTTGFSKNEVFQIENSSCELKEIMVYLVNTQNQYESVYGSPIWDIKLEDASLEEMVKETVLARIAQVKTMNLLAQEKGIALDEEEQGRIIAAANEYYSSLNDFEIELLGVKQKDIEAMYAEYALAEKVYRHIIKDINPEISDDEARSILIEQIVIKTYTLDGAGNKIPYSTKAQAEAFEKAQNAMTMVKSGEYEFAAVAEEYSEVEQIQISFGKGDLNKEVEEVAFNMENMEISSIIESEEGYHIIRCLSTYNQEQTDANKIKIMEERKQEVFGQEYDSFVETLTRRLNTKLWEQISLEKDENVKTDSFFFIYSKYFPEEIQ